MPTLSFYIAALSFTLVCIFLIFLIAIPLLKIHSRKQEGAVVYFFPLVGFLRYWMKSLDKNSDVMDYSKSSFTQFPKHKFVLTNAGTNIFVLLRDPEYIKAFLQNPHLYHKNYHMDFLKVLIGDGLVLAEGETWKRHRRIISSSFHFDFIRDHIETIQQTTREFLDNYSPEDFKEFHAIRKLQEITGEIVGRVFFGENLQRYSFEGKSLCLGLADITSELSNCSRSPLVLLFGAEIMNSPFIPRLKRILDRVKNFRKLCLQIIKDRKTSSQQNHGLLASLLNTQNLSNPEDQFSDEEIVNEFLTFFLAGMDTTGHLLGMALYNLTQYPEYLELLQKERNICYNQKTTIDNESLQKMEILHSFLKETLRFYSPAPSTFPRVAIADHKIADLSIKKGDFVIPEFFASAFNDKNFELPGKFNPERWRNDTSGKIDPFSFVPFSAGPRNCIGQHLAIIESKIIMSEFLERFSFTLKEGYKLRMLIRFLYEPEIDVTLRLSPIKL